VAAREVLVLSAFVAALGGASNAQADIVLDERPRLLLAVSIAGRGETAAPLSELVQIAAEALESRAALRLLTPERAGLEPSEIARCKMSPSCWVSQLGNQAPKYLLVLGVLTDLRAPNVFSALLLDVEQTRRLIENESAANAAWREGVDEVIAREGVVGRSDLVEVGSKEEVRLYFAQLFGVVLRPALERDAEWGSDGAIAIEGTRAGATIELDGNVIGVTSNEKTTISGLRPGRRNIAVSSSADGGERAERAIEVARGEIARWTLPALGVATADQDWLLYSGIGAVGASAVVLGYALLTSPDTQRLRVCVGEMAGAPGCATESRFRSVGGVRLAPLGYALASAGLVWIVTSQLFNEELPAWLSLVIGAGLGAAIYGASVALE
jgi:hypothetical protein